ncbi:unnamed protein product [Aphanomyces euteiches]
MEIIALQEELEKKQTELNSLEEDLVRLHLRVLRLKAPLAYLQCRLANLKDDEEATLITTEKSPNRILQ